MLTQTPITTQTFTTTNTIVLWGTTVAANSTGTTGLTYSAGSYTNSTSSTLVVEVQYNLIFDSSVSGATYINVNGTTYSLTQFNAYVMTNSGTFLLAPAQSFTIYNQNSSTGLILQTTSDIVITILVAGQQGPQGATGPTGPTTATNIAGGIASQIPYQTAPSTTAFIPNGTAGQVLTSNGTSVPTWVSKAFVYTTSSSISQTSQTYATPGLVMFGGTVSPYLDIKTTSGLTNSGTNGWVRSAVAAQAGRFYSPTTTKWLVNLVVQHGGVVPPANGILLNLYTSGGVLRSSRAVVIVFVAGTQLVEYTCIQDMNAGDYFQFESGTNIAVNFESEFRTTLQVQEL